MNAVEQYKNIFSEEKSKLGSSFHVIIDALPFPISRPYNYIVDVADTVSTDKQRKLIQRDDVKSSPEAISQLVKFGITPIKLFRSFLAIEDIMLKYGEGEDTLIVNHGENIYSNNIKINKYLVSEVCSFAKVNEKVAKRLLIWCLNLSKFKNEVFKNYDINYNDLEYKFIEDPNKNYIFEN